MTWVKNSSCMDLLRAAKLWRTLEGNPATDVANGNCLGPLVETVAGERGQEMAATDMISIDLERNWSMVDNAIKSLPDEELNQQLDDQSNSVDWLLWHKNRVVDNMIHTRLQSQRQLWVLDGWYQAQHLNLAVG